MTTTVTEREGRHTDLPKFRVVLGIEARGGVIGRTSFGFPIEAEAEQFIAASLLADCVLYAERAWRTGSDPSAVVAKASAS